MKQFTPVLLKLLYALVTVALAAPTSAAPSISASEDQLIQLACHHDVVMLGENSHGDGATIALKAKLIPELVRRCGFSAIAFESGFYDFLELTHTTKPDRRYDRAKFLSSVGRLWAQDSEFAPLADWVSTKTPRTLQVAGVDDQIGAVGAFYSLEQMPSELASMIAPRDRGSCRDIMIAYINYSTDRGTAQRSVDRCLSLAMHELSGRKSADAAKLRVVGRAFGRATAWTQMSSDEVIAARDQAMGDELQAFRRGLKKGSKVIVWTANAHAAYGGYQTGKTLAQITRERIGPRLFTVGSSAAAGEYRWSKSDLRPIPASAPGKLEYTILGNRSAAVASRAELQRIGTIPGTALSWHKPVTADWSKLFDAVYVIARERPTTLIETQ
jgi:erythromycin esterase-like protein